MSYCFQAVGQDCCIYFGTEQEAMNHVQNANRRNLWKYVGKLDREGEYNILREDPVNELVMKMGSLEYKMSQFQQHTCRKCRQEFLYDEDLQVHLGICSTIEDITPHEEGTCEFCTQGRIDSFNILRNDYQEAFDEWAMHMAHEPPKQVPGYEV